MGSFCITDPTDKIYRGALRREFEVWRRSEEAQDAIPYSPEFHPAFFRAVNVRMIGMADSDELAWVRWLRGKLPPPGPSLSLGSGSGRHDRAFIEEGLVEKWESIDIISGESEAGLAEKDLNFIRLPSNRFRLILCKGVLHHIVNLEHLLHQVAGALAEDGVLVIHDYIGENKQQVRAAKVRRFNEEMAKHFGARLPDLSLHPVPLTNEVPFEGIRSEDITGVLDHYFGDAKVHEVIFGGLFYPVVLAKGWPPSCKAKLSEDDLVGEVLDYASELEERFAGKEECSPPCLLFGLYRKPSPRPPLEVREWTRSERMERLNLRLPFGESVRRKMKRLPGLTPLVRALRGRPR